MKPVQAAIHKGVKIGNRCPFERAMRDRPASRKQQRQRGKAHQDRPQGVAHPEIIAAGVQIEKAGIHRRDDKSQRQKPARGQLKRRIVLEEGEPGHLEQAQDRDGDERDSARDGVRPDRRPPEPVAHALYQLDQHRDGPALQECIKFVLHS